MTEKFLTVFAGTTLKIPSTKDFNDAQRNLAIYDSLKVAVKKEDAARMRALLGAQYGLRVKEVRYLFRKMKKLVKEAEKFKQDDMNVGRHQPSKIRVRRKKKRRM